MIYCDLSSQSLNLYSIHTSYKLISNIYSLFSKFYNVCVAFAVIITSGYDYISLSLIRTENSCVSLFLNMLSRKSIYKQTNKQTKQTNIPNILEILAQNIRGKLNPTSLCDHCCYWNLGISPSNSTGCAFFTDEVEKGALVASGSLSLVNFGRTELRFS